MRRTWNNQLNKQVKAYGIDMLGFACSLIISSYGLQADSEPTTGIEGHIAGKGRLRCKDVLQRT